MGLPGLEKLSCKNKEVALREEQDGGVTERGRKTECGSRERLGSEQGGDLKPPLYKPQTSLVQTREKGKRMSVDVSMFRVKEAGSSNGYS